MSEAPPRDAPLLEAPLLEVRGLKTYFRGEEGLSRAVDGVDLDDAVVGPGGIILIEPGSNDELLDAFDANVAAAADLFDDDDGDGGLDAPERAPGEELAEGTP